MVGMGGRKYNQKVCAIHHLYQCICDDDILLHLVLGLIQNSNHLVEISCRRFISHIHNDTVFFDGLYNLLYHIFVMVVK